MNSSVLILAIAGLFCFFAGAYLAATNDNRTTGIVLMSMGLLFQVVCLRQLKMNKTKDDGDAG
ncbi:hypothetical protein [Erythrobacter crassostreae]|uniref:Uncharacterized protein n=1 Tax=Erythrobacter crassostreae TaxID=2828328 RepID=A0A9X1JP06_9SPHN|nr:hypothetical protein [Erythrobacter crassostrea]MBV7260213.1 hypothetical protein [Erythrobacter crassostrea]